MSASARSTFTDRQAEDSHPLWPSRREGSVLHAPTHSEPPRARPTVGPISACGKLFRAIPAPAQFCLQRGNAFVPLEENRGIGAARRAVSICSPQFLGRPCRSSGWVGRSSPFTGSRIRNSRQRPSERTVAEVRQNANLHVEPNVRGIVLPAGTSVRDLQRALWRLSLSPDPARSAEAGTHAPHRHHVGRHTCRTVAHPVAVEEVHDDEDVCEFREACTQCPSGRGNRPFLLDAVRRRLPAGTGIATGRLPASGGRVSDRPTLADADRPRPSTCSA